MNIPTAAALVVPVLLIGTFFYRRFRAEYRKIAIRSENEALHLIYHAILNSDAPKFATDPNTGNLEAKIGHFGTIRLRPTTKIERFVHDMPTVAFIHVKNGNTFVATASIFLSHDIWGVGSIVRAKLENGDPQSHRSDSTECARDLQNKIASEVAHMTHRLR